MSVSPLPKLPESERLRLLSLLGFCAWQRRSTRAAGERSGAAQPVRAAPAERAAPQLPKTAPIEAVRAKVPTPLRAGGSLCLLVLAERRHADAPLVKALAGLLPGAMLCTADSAQSVAARFAVSLGVAPLSLPGVLVIELPTLAELIGSGSGKRRVWSKLKPLLRELGR